jgi:CRP/FNR family transcriptional regulator, cyclic AMP receptor protein
MGDRGRIEDRRRRAAAIACPEFIFAQIVRQTPLRAPPHPNETFLTSGIGGAAFPSWLKQCSSRFKPKALIFHQNMIADAVFYIVRGRVQISVVSPQGKEATIAMLGRGDFFGEECLTSHNWRSASATATAESTLFRLDKNLMIRALHDEPAFAQLFMNFLLVRNARISSDLIDQLFNSSEKRLARTLLLLANYGGANQTSTIPQISQRALAARVGTTRSRINVFLKKFRRLGYIEGDREMKINESLLRILMDD